MKIVPGYFLGSGRMTGWQDGDRMPAPVDPGINGMETGCEKKMHETYFVVAKMTPPSCRRPKKQDEKGQARVPHPVHPVS